MPVPEDVTSTGTLGVLVVGASSHNVVAGALAVGSLIAAVTTQGQLFADQLTAGAATPSMDSFLVANPSTMQGAGVPFPRTTVYAMHIASRLVVDSRPLFQVARNAFDGGMLSDAVFQAFGPNLQSAGTFNAAPFPRTVAQPTLAASHMTAGALLDGARGYFVTADTMTAGADTFRRTAVSPILAASPMTATADLVVNTVRTADLVDTGAVDSNLHPQLTALATLIAPTMFVETFVQASVTGDGATQLTAPSAWTANTDNWAMTRYAPFEMDSVASWGGKLYATNAWGLVELSGPTDRGADIVARADSHLTDFKDNRLKLPRAFYLGYRSEQPLTVTMSATDSGEETAYEYTAPPRLAETFVPDRVPVGRGLRSRYFRYSLLNEAGGFFSIDTAFVDADISDRRL